MSAHVAVEVQSEVLVEPREGKVSEPTRQPANDPATADGYGGISWTERSHLSGLRSVLDSADVQGKKNAFIDAIHSSVIEDTLEARGTIDRALDFGCGVGRLTPLLRRFAREVHAVDRTPGMLDVARANRILPEDHLHLWQSGAMPFDPGTFDFVLSVYVFSCIPNANVLEGLHEIGRVTAARAQFLMIEQISPARGLTHEYYADQLRSAGFSVVSARPIRGSTSPLVRYISRSWFPPALLRAAAQLERRTASYRRYRPTEYYDYAIVAERAEP